jgi:hypothetical protein
MKVTETHFFGESLETLSAVESLFGVLFLGCTFFNPQGPLRGGPLFVYVFQFRPYFTKQRF